MSKKQALSITRKAEIKASTFEERLKNVIENHTSGNTVLKHMVCLLSCSLFIQSIRKVRWQRSGRAYIQRCFRLTFKETSIPCRKSIPNKWSDIFNGR